MILHMRCNWRYPVTLIGLLLTVIVYSQAPEWPLAKRIILKTNVLSLIARKPTVSIEKMFGKHFGGELSFVQGQFNNILLTDHYAYQGFLVRVKRYFPMPGYGQLRPYLALYAGNLQRTIRSVGWTDNSGWFGYRPGEFSANSIRGGISFGTLYASKSRIVVDGLASIGYGGYTRIYKTDINRNRNGYPDLQVWISVGYLF